MNLVTLGINAALDENSYVYTVQNKSTGEVRTITTSDAESLGQRIADGDFD
jgi:hypothetical protein